MNHIFGFTIDASHIGCLLACLYLFTSLFGFLCVRVSGNCYRKSLLCSRIFPNLKQNKHHHIVLFCSWCACVFFVLFASTANIFSIICIILYRRNCSVYSLSSMRTGADKFLELLNRSIYFSMCSFPITHSLSVWLLICTTYHIAYPCLSSIFPLCCCFFPSANVQRYRITYSIIRAVRYNEINSPTQWEFDQKQSNRKIPRNCMITNHHRQRGEIW